MIRHCSYIRSGLPKNYWGRNSILLWYLRWVSKSTEVTVLSMRGIQNLDVFIYIFIVPVQIELICNITSSLIRRALTRILEYLGSSLFSKFWEGKHTSTDSIWMQGCVINRVHIHTTVSHAQQYWHNRCTDVVGATHNGTLVRHSMQKTGSRNKYVRISHKCGHDGDHRAIWQHEVHRHLLIKTDTAGEGLVCQYHLHGEDSKIVISGISFELECAACKVVTL